MLKRSDWLDLEAVMPSFKGTFAVDEDEALVELAGDDLRPVIEEWRARWWDLAAPIVAAVRPIFECAPIGDEIAHAVAAYWAACGLGGRS